MRFARGPPPRPPNEGFREFLPMRRRLSDKPV